MSDSEKDQRSKHIKEYLDIHRRKLHHHLKTMGHLSVSEQPFSLISEINSAREGIRNAKAALRSMGVYVEDLPDDEPAHILQSDTTDSEVIYKPPVFYEEPTYIMSGSFVGRAKEMAQLDEWGEQQDAVMVVDAIGGNGKSALTWEWVQKQKTAHRYAGGIWWSFYDSGATIDSFIRHALAYVTAQNPERLKGMKRATMTKRLLVALDQAPYLIALDGLERVLVAYHRIDRAYLRDDEVKSEEDLRACIEPFDDEFLKQLTTLQQTKVLISTRLMPRTLEDVDQPMPGVRHLRLQGFTTEDAVALLQHFKVQNTDSPYMEEFLRHIGHHPLLLRIVANLIVRYRSAPRCFSSWYQDEAKRMNLAQLTESKRRTHILQYAVNALTDDQKRLLSQIAAFSDPINYQTISILNTYRPARPVSPQLPGFPQTRPNPFGSIELARLRRQRMNARTTQEQEALDAAISAQMRRDEQHAAVLQRSQMWLEKQTQEVKIKRQRLREEYERSYRATPEYISAEKQFFDDLETLEDRGLLSWEQTSNTYDLHPVVRGFAFGMLQQEERHKVFGRIRDHFASLPEIEPSKIRDLTDIRDIIDAYRALIQTKEFDQAYAWYQKRIGPTLHRLAKHKLVIELLQPLFADGIQHPPQLQSSTAQGYVLNELALAFQRTGKLAEARTLYELAIDPDFNANWRDLATVIGNYASVLSDMNHLALAHRVNELEALIQPPEDRGWTLWRQLNFARLTGQRDKADAVSAEATTVTKPNGDSDLWECRIALAQAMYRVAWQLSDAEAVLRQADSVIHTFGELRSVEALHGCWARYLLNQNQLDAAREHINKAISIARQNNHPYADSLSLLARIDQKHGQSKAHCLDMIEEATKISSQTPIQAIQVFADTAVIYEAFGLHTEAARYAQRAYAKSRADGAPYHHWWPMQQAKEVLERLGEPVPILAPFDAASMPPFPHEETIRQRHLNPHGSLTGLQKAPQVQLDFMIGRFNWVQMGVLAVFGVDDTVMIMRLAEKITSLSYVPTSLVMSRMGEEIPEPTLEEMPFERQSFRDLEFTFDETRHLDKFFVIAFIDAIDSNGEQVFAYVNVRLDRLEALLDLGEQGTVFNLPDRATVVITGTGMPDDQEREKLRRDYVFGEHSMNVRLFPPLSEVT